MHGAKEGLYLLDVMGNVGGFLVQFRDEIKCVAILRLIPRVMRV
ncbi:hypothetical protein JCM19241_2944 [Vibrio ishigakensis]|uniref:Uncharacterized protein n=1 Tax=Vibrio ishigakensis TaxID=1481914 RepID=A0A0B8QFT9_9VIBR|nr:hypothetical protein JCM19241_2944 [Vibrio ishigakensis]